MESSANPLHTSLNNGVLDVSPTFLASSPIPPQRKPYWPLCFVYAFYSIIYTLVIPALPAVALRLTHDDSSKSSYIYGIANFTRYITEFFAAPFLGTCTDVVGRKPMLCLSFFICAAEFALLAMAPSIPTLILSRMMSGMLDSGIPTAYTMFTDLALYNHDNITTKFGLASAIMGIGFIMGPLAGGVLVDISIETCFFVAAILSIVGLIGTFLFLEETVDLVAKYKHHIARSFRDVQWRELNPIPPLFLHFSNNSMRDLLIPLAFENFPAGTGSIWYIYMDYQFHASSTDVGIFLSFFGILSALVQAFAVHRIIPGVVNELQASIYGGYLSAIQCGAFGFMPVYWSIFVLYIVTCLGMLNDPALKGLIVKESLKHPDGVQLQGNLQGVMCSIRTLMLAFGSLTFASLFAVSVDVNPPMPYLSFLVAGFAFLLSSMYLAYFIDDQVGGEEGVSRSVSFAGEKNNDVRNKVGLLYSPVLAMDDEHENGNGRDDDDDEEGKLRH